MDAPEKIKIQMKSLTVSRTQWAGVNRRRRAATESPNPNYLSIAFRNHDKAIASILAASEFQ